MLQDMNFYFHDRFSSAVHIVSQLIIDEFGDSRSNKIRSIKVLDNYENLLPHTQQD